MKKPTFSFSERSIDQTVSQSYGWMGRTLRLMRRPVRPWHAIALIVFMAGIAAGFIWTISANWDLYSEASAAGSGIGLMGEYFNHSDLTDSRLKRVDPAINFNWRSGAPDPSLDPDTFSVRWTGFIEPTHSEDYRFSARSSDGARLWVNNRLLIDNWRQSARAKKRSPKIFLNAGQRYPIRLEYFEQVRHARVELAWQSPHQPRQVVPGSQLYPTAAASATLPSPNQPAQSFPLPASGGVFGPPPLPPPPKL